MDIYSDWAYRGAVELGLWQSRAEFRQDWIHSSESFTAKYGPEKEGTIRRRIRGVLEARLNSRKEVWPEQKVVQTVESVHQIYWSCYCQASFVLPEVHEALDFLKEKKLPMGVASNFMVEDGIQELLARHGLAEYFDVVLVSCDMGWKKPSVEIYKAAIQAARCSPDCILFVGDNLIADYMGPRKMNMKSVLYDLNNRHSEQEHRICSLKELSNWL